MKSTAGRTASAAVLGVLAVAFTVIEFSVPTGFTLPGLKLGLANTVILFAVRRRKTAEAFFVTLTKVAASALLSGSVSGFLYSLSGSALAFLGMAAINALLKEKVGTVGVSVVGAFLHNAGQFFVSLFFFGAAALYYLPFLLFFGVITGAVTGIAAHFVILAVNKAENKMKY